MIWRSRLNAECDYFNERWLEFTGRTLEEEIGNGWAEGVHRDDLGRCLQIYRAAFEKRIAFEMEYRLRRHDGTYRWIFDRGVPFYDDNGNFAGFIGSCIDITEKVQQLRGLLPICSSCKAIRDDQGYWKQLEAYISEHTEANFSHGLCPPCAQRLYPEFFSNND